MSSDQLVSKPSCRCPKLLGGFNRSWVRLERPVIDHAPACVKEIAAGRGARRS